MTAMSAIFVLIIRYQTLGIGSFVWKTNGSETLVLCSKTGGSTFRRLCDSVQRPKAVLLPYIVNALCDCGTGFEDRRLYISTALRLCSKAVLLPYIVNALCDCGTGFKDRRLYISTALFKDRRPCYYRTMPTVSPC